MCIWVLGTVSLRVIGVYAPAEQVSQNGIPDAPLFNHPLIFYKIKHLATPLLFYCLSSPPLHLWCQRKEKDSSICFAKIALGWGYLFDPVLQVKSFLDIGTFYLNHLFWTYLQQSDQICLRLFCVLLVWGYKCFRRVTEESCLMPHFLSARKILKTKKSYCHISRKECNSTVLLSPQTNFANFGIFNEMWPNKQEGEKGIKIINSQDNIFRIMWH